MKKIALFTIIILALAASGCQSLEMVPDPDGPEHPGYDFTEHDNYRHLAVSIKGLYNLELSFREGTLRTGLNDMDITIRDKDGRDITGAQVSVIPVMKDLGRESGITASVMEQGSGTYTAKNVDIPMPGLWELKVRVSSLMADDEATFEFMVDAGGGIMDPRYTAPDTLRGNEMGRTRARSARGLFEVTYEAPSPVPLGRLISWNILITTPRWESVTGARITVSGGMPALGYRLPTRPVVVDTGIPGRYRIDRLKFTEPGVWVVKIHIDTGFDKDTAEFLIDVH